MTGGVIAQWIPMYQLSPTDWATIIHTFTSVFPNSSLWYSGIDVVLVGFKGDVRIDPDRMAEKMSNPKIMRDLLTMGVHSPGEVFGWFVAGPDQLQQMGAAAPINTVDRPVLEYTAPRCHQSRKASPPPCRRCWTALEDLDQADAPRQLSALCTRPLNAQETFDMLNNQAANKWVMRAMIFDSLSRPDQFLQAMEQARALRPQDIFIARELSEAQAREGNACYDNGDITGSFRLYQQGLLNDPTSMQSLAGGVQCAIDRRDFQTGHALLAAVAPGSRDELQVLIYTGLLALAEGDYTAARAAFDRASSHGQETIDLLIARGVLALKDRDQRARRRVLPAGADHDPSAHADALLPRLHGGRARGR